MENLKIRRFEISDRTGIENILCSDDSFVPGEIAVALELVDDAIANAQSDYWIRVAVIDTDLVGYICYGPTPMTASTYDLYWIVTHARHRGKRIAKQLIARMEEELMAMSEHAQIRVETSQTDGYEAARKLYNGLGYPELARFKNFYNEGDDLIVFFKCL